MCKVLSKHILLSFESTFICTQLCTKSFQNLFYYHVRVPKLSKEEIFSARYTVMYPIKRQARAAGKQKLKKNYISLMKSLNVIQPFYLLHTLLFKSEFWRTFSKFNKIMNFMNTCIIYYDPYIWQPVKFNEIISYLVFKHLNKLANLRKPGKLWVEKVNS